MKCLFSNKQKQNTLKSCLLLGKIQTLQVNNSRIRKIKNAKFAGYYFFMNMNIYRDCQICISVLLINNISVNIKLIENIKTPTYCPPLPAITLSRGCYTFGNVLYQCQMKILYGKYCQIFRNYQ